MNNSIRLSTSTVLPLVFVSIAAVAQDAEQQHTEDELEVVVVTTPFEESEAETALPIGILSAEALREKVGNSIGETLKNEIGVNSASFGNGVGQPIIRGQTGNRVSVLQNGISLTDASNVSPDHANGVEVLLADRIEVLRGPSALLYGSGAIGGVVNVIDSRIPDRLVDGPSMILEQSFNSVNDENRSLVKFDTSSGNFGFHFDGFRRENDNMEVRGLAIDEDALHELEELSEALHAEDEDEHEHEEEEELINTDGFVANSDGEAEGGTVGFSHVTDRGFFGFSVGRLENHYGLPPGTHGHGEEEHHEDEDEMEDEEEHEEEGQELVRLSLEQTRYDFKGMLNFENGWFDNLRANIGFTDYEHQEIEFEPDGEQVLGTVFNNEGVEGRVALNHRHRGDWAGVWGLQFAATEFSAMGEEAFIPVSDLTNLGLFGMHRYSNERITGELGLRVETNGVDPAGACDFDETSTSLSGSLLYELDADSNMLLGLTRSQRGPSVEELYSNISATTCAAFADEDDYVLHAATALLEIGNPNLKQETSNNIEFGYRRHSGRVTGELSAYYNEIDDYIFLDITGEEIEEQQVARYFARDAIFQGFEAEVSIELVESSMGNLVLGFHGDLVKAEFESGGFVPRIPASKFGSELRWFGNNWSTHIHVTRVREQNDTAMLELPTDSYTNLSFYADYHWNFGSQTELQLFVQGDNLLDEEIRNHASILKNFSPEAGRGIRLGVRLFY